MYLICVLSISERTVHNDAMNELERHTVDFKYQGYEYLLHRCRVNQTHVISIIKF